MSKIRKLLRCGILYFMVSPLLVLTLQAQSGNISGIVTDSSRRAVLVGAHIKVEGQARNYRDQSGF